MRKRCFFKSGFIFTQWVQSQTEEKAVRKAQKKVEAQRYGTVIAENVGYLLNNLCGVDWVQEYWNHKTSFMVEDCKATEPLQILTIIFKTGANSLIEDFRFGKGNSAFNWDSKFSDLQVWRYSTYIGILLILLLRKTRIISTKILILKDQLLLLLCKKYGFWKSI